MIFQGFNYFRPLFIAIIRTQLSSGSKDYRDSRDYYSDLIKALDENKWEVGVHNSSLNMLQGKKGNSRIVFGCIFDQEIKEFAVCASLHSETSEIGDKELEGLEQTLTMIEPAYYVGKLATTLRGDVSEN